MSGTHRPSVNLWIVVAVWMAVCAIYVAREMVGGSGMPLISDTDDAMRLTQVRDLIGGTGWFDHVQARLNTPYGAEIHWSRLIDLPLAGLTLALAPVAGGNAIIWAAWAWPLLLLLTVLALSTALSLHMVGDKGLLPGLVLPALSAAVLAEFSPGRVDHHNVQIILTLFMLWAAVRAWTAPGYAIVAGLAAATSLAIGLEALPVIAACVAAFGLAWVVDPAHGRALRFFGVSFGVGTSGHLVLAWPPGDWFTPACDALSPTYAAAALGVGIVAVGLTALPLGTWWGRITAGTILGFGLVAGLAFSFPGCLTGPYAEMDPWLRDHWLTGIVEAKPAWESIRGLPAYTLGIVIPPVIGLAVTVTRIVRTTGARRGEWMTLGIFLVIGLVVTLLQIRGARLVAPMAVPAAAWLIVWARERYLNGRRIADAGLLVGTWIVSAGLAVSVIAALLLPGGTDEIAVADTAQSRYACLEPRAFADLAPLPPERVMAPVDLGAHLMFFTPHAVVGAPYHRNQQGVRDTFDFFNTSSERAHAIAAERGIGLIVTCPYLAEMKGLANATDDALVRRFAAGDLPDWLEDVSLPGGTLNVYAVLN